MSIDKFWKQLHADPMACWLHPMNPNLLVPEFEGRIIWCGIGGSLLPADSLVRMLGKSTQVLDWVTLSSPESMPELELRRTDQVVFASKSGTTLEVWAWIGKLLKHPDWNILKKTPIVITLPNGNSLHQIATDKNWILLPFPSGVGGRYSVFTTVGYLPLLWLGKNPELFVESGRSVVQQVHDKQGLWFDHINNLVDLWLKAYRQDICTWVFMPYSRQLRYIGGWWTQLVCESLGKMASDKTRRGINAIRAVGPQDQHSQLQRWLAGPQDIGVIFLYLRSQNTTQEYCVQPAKSPVPFLSKHTGEDILKAQISGTEKVLITAGVKTHKIELYSIDETEIGALMMAWQIIVSIVGYGLEINPFDQPDIERGKSETVNMLNS